MTNFKDINGDVVMTHVKDISFLHFIKEKKQALVHFKCGHFVTVSYSVGATLYVLMKQVLST